MPRSRSRSDMHPHVSGSSSWRGNHGGEIARQAGLDQARGDFIQFLDADDLLSREKIELQVTALLGCKETDLVASCGWSRFYGDAPAGEPSAVREPVWGNFDPVGWIVTSQLGGGMMPIHAWLTPRSVAERAGRWMTRRARNADGQYFTRVLLASRGVRSVESARAFDRSGVGGWSGSRERVALEGLYGTLESIAERLRAAEDTPRTHLAVATMFKRFIWKAARRMQHLVAPLRGRLSRTRSSREDGEGRQRADDNE